MASKCCIVEEFLAAKGPQLQRTVVCDLLACSKCFRTAIRGKSFWKDPAEIPLLKMGSITTVRLGYHHTQILQWQRADFHISRTLNWQRVSLPLSFSLSVCVCVCVSLSLTRSLFVKLKIQIWTCFRLWFPKAATAQHQLVQQAAQGSDGGAQRQEAAQEVCEQQTNPQHRPPNPLKAKTKTLRCEWVCAVTLNKHSNIIL